MIDLNEQSRPSKRPAPTSADVEAMLRIFEFTADHGDIADSPWPARAEALFEAWYASLDIPEPVR